MPQVKLELGLRLGLAVRWHGFKLYYIIIECILVYIAPISSGTDAYKQT